MLSKPKNDIGKELEVICPYCKKVLEQKPLRKKKCPFCKNFIYPRTLRSTGDELLLTEDKAKEFDLRKKWIGGTTEKAFNTHKKKLSKELGQEASDL
jgi:phage FluMu protein Com